MGNATKSLLAVTGIIVVLCGVGFVSRRNGNPQAVAAGAREEVAPAKEVSEAGTTRVEVMRPKAGGLERSTTQPGTVRAFEYEQIFAKVSGYLKDQSVDIGSQVKKGQLLAEIDAPELIKEVEHASAALEQAKAQVKQMESHVAAAQADLASAKTLVTQREAEVLRSKSNLGFRDKQYRRIKELADLKSVDDRMVDEKFEQYESAQSWFDAAKAAVENAKTDVLAKTAKVEQAKADLIAAQANVGVAQATLGKARVFLDFTRIISHYDGVVTERNYHNGDFIRQADQGARLPLLTVQRTDKMRVVVRVPDGDVPFADVDDPVDLVIDSLPDGVFLNYKISRVAYSEDEQSRTMRVEIDVPNTKKILRDGMYGRVTIHLQSPAKDSFTLPTACIVHSEKNQGTAGVYVIRGNKSFLVPVRVGVDNGQEVEIITGVTANDLVVTQHFGPLANGMSVDLENLPHQAPPKR